MSDICYNMNGYPEAECVYLGTSSIPVFSLFPRRQQGHPAQLCNDYDPNKTFYDANKPLFYDIEIQPLFNTKSFDDCLFASDVDLFTAKQLCKEFINKWCESNGLKLL